jgi:hypothetical protein
MSKTWREQPRTNRVDQTPQKAIDRLVMKEAEEDIREALNMSWEVTNASK